MPHTYIGYAISGGLTVAAGLLFKLRKGEYLTLREKFILALALIVWGLVSYALLRFLFPEHVDQDFQLAFLAVPLGVGFSETFASLIAALNKIFDLLPDWAKGILKYKFGRLDK